MEVQDFKDILYNKEENGIVTVTLNMPKRKNALSAYTFLELWWAVDAMEKDDAAKAMIITGARDPDSHDPTKEAFSSGGYFRPDATAGLSDAVKAEVDYRDIAQKKFCLKMWQFDKPVIAAMNGMAIGGAFTMCLSCADLIYASEHAWAQFPFVNLGLVPEIASSYILPRLVGFQRAKEIIYFGERIPAQELCRLGLVNKVLPHDELMSYAREAALRLIPPHASGWAVSKCKQMLHQPLIEAVVRALDRENEVLNIAFKGADFLEAMRARMEKRPPRFGEE